MDANTAVERMTPECHAQMTVRLATAGWLKGGAYFDTHTVFHKRGRMLYLPVVGQPLPDGSLDGLDEQFGGANT